MMVDRIHPSATVTRKSDDLVGTPGTAPVSGGRHTAQQATITQIASSCRSDAEREQSWGAMGGQPGRASFATGGASGGHADQKSARDDGDMIAAGHYSIEKRGSSDAKG